MWIYNSWDKNRSCNNQRTNITSGTYIPGVSTTSGTYIPGVSTTSGTYMPAVPAAPPTPSFTREARSSYIVGKSPSTAKTPATDNNIRFISTVTDSNQCEALCASQPWCNAYTWFDSSSTSGAEANSCYGINDASRVSKNPLSDADSGIKTALYNPTWNIAQ